MIIPKIIIITLLLCIYLLGDHNFSMIVNDNWSQLIILLIVWFIFGIFIGMTQTVFIIYIYRIWLSRANIIYNKLQLFNIFGNIFFILLLILCDNMYENMNDLDSTFDNNQIFTGFYAIL